MNKTLKRATENSEILSVDFGEGWGILEDAPLPKKKKNLNRIKVIKIKL